MKKKTSREWCDEFGIVTGYDILDPDGWDRRNLRYSFYEEKIGIKEFNERVCNSTIRINASGFDNMDIELANSLPLPK